MEDVDKVYPADLKILVLLGECVIDGRLYSGINFPEQSEGHFSIPYCQRASVFQLLYCLPVRLMRIILKSCA
jgi:hypothetical protein